MLNYRWFNIFLSVCTGILLAYHGSTPAMLLSAGIMAFLLFFYWKKEMYWLTVIGILLGMACYTLAAPCLPAPSVFTGEREVSGRIETYPGFDGARSSFVLRTDIKEVYLKRLQVFCSFKCDFPRGSVVTVKGQIKPPERPGNPGEFDYNAYLRHKNIYYIMQVDSPQAITVKSFPGQLLKLSSYYRNHMEALVNRLLPGEQAAILLGMVLGHKENIDRKQYQDFQQIGIVHIFAVSGMHIGFVVLLSTAIASAFRLPRQASFILVMVLLLFYGTVVGWPVSVKRAVIMAALSLFAYFVGRDNKPLNGLGLAGLIILLRDPGALFDLGFQLSFLSTWGLVYIFPVVKGFLPRQSKIIDLILLPLCAQVTIIPLIAFHFNLLTPSAIISNIAVSYLAGGIVILGFSALMLAVPFPLFAPLFIYPAGALAHILLAFTAVLKELPAAFICVATPHMLLSGMYYGGLLLLFTPPACFGGKRNVRAGLSLIAVALLIMLLPPGWHNRGIAEAVFIDVGQGDSILLKSPRGKFILIDGGGSDFYDVGSRKVLPYLQHLGIGELFLAVNTHPDTDHLKGLEEVIQEIPVKYIAVPGAFKGCTEYRSLESTALERQIPLLTISRGNTILVEKGFILQVLHPEAKTCDSSNYNSDSLVLLLKYRSFSMLLSGDIGKESLQKLEKDKLIGPVTVVKVPHHGSRNSLLPSFYERIRPQAAIISAGAKNPFGHPHPEVIGVLQDKKIPVYRTDEKGAVSIQSDGQKTTISTFR